MPCRQGQSSLRGFRPPSPRGGTERTAQNDARPASPRGEPIGASGATRARFAARLRCVIRVA